MASIAVALVKALSSSRRGWALGGRLGSGCSHHRDAAVRFDHVSTRRAGQRRLVDVHMHLPASWSLARSASLRAQVERDLMRAVPGLRATIQLLPVNVETHFFDEDGVK